MVYNSNFRVSEQVKGRYLCVMIQSQEIINYNRIASAIEYIKQNFKDQPSLDELAQKVNLSPFHFQRLFTEWAGVSPKQFIHYLSVNYAKQVLAGQQATLFDAAEQTGLSGTGRLHDLFVKIEGMTPLDYKNGGEKLAINYNVASTVFGLVLVASTYRGICYMSFVDDENEGFQDLVQLFPNAVYKKSSDLIQEAALRIFSGNAIDNNPVKIHLKGTDFQLKVWEALLKIPLGKLSSYKQVAEEIGKPLASRAVGTAIGENPVAFIIPCHRVIQAGGMYGEYRWGSTRKSALIGWEAAQVSEL